MPIKKEYKSKTYGLQEKQCIKLFNQQVKKAKDYKGYDILGTPTKALNIIERLN